MEVGQHTLHHNKGIDNGTSYKPISLLSVIADTREEPFSLHNIKHKKHTHATRVQNTTLYSDGTTLIKQHRSKGVQPNGPMHNAEVNIKLHQWTQSLTTYRNNTSTQRQVKTSVPQSGVLSSKLFKIYTADLPPPRAPVQVMAYADSITITSTDTNTSAAKKHIEPYIHKVFARATHNNLTLN